MLPIKGRGWNEKRIGKSDYNHMKKSYLSWNKDTVKDDVIFEHLYELSGGSWIYFKVPKSF
jgi:hypothetical protein